MKAILSIICVIAFATFIFKSKYIREIYHDFMDDSGVKKASDKIGSIGHF